MKEVRFTASGPLTGRSTEPTGSDLRDMVPYPALRKGIVFTVTRHFDYIACRNLPQCGGWLAVVLDAVDCPWGKVNISNGLLYGYEYIVKANGGPAVASVKLNACSARGRGEALHARNPVYCYLGLIGWRCIRRLVAPKKSAAAEVKDAAYARDCTRP